MSDLIDRYDAITVCNSVIDLWKGQLGVGALVAVRDKIAELPSAEPEPHWIPCTPETMPKEHSDVLCCDAYGEQIIGMPYADDDSNTGYSAESEAMYMVDCIAWQPLPEPYQPEEK